MGQKTIQVRIRLRTFNKLKRAFPSWKGETAANYFERLAEMLNDLWLNDLWCDEIERNLQEKN